MQRMLNVYGQQNKAPTIYRIDQIKQMRGSAPFTGALRGGTRSQIHEDSRRPLLTGKDGSAQLEASKMALASNPSLPASGLQGGSISALPLIQCQRRPLLVWLGMARLSISALPAPTPKPPQHAPGAATVVSFSGLAPMYEATATAPPPCPPISLMLAVAGIRATPSVASDAHTAKGFASLMYMGAGAKDEGNNDVSSSCALLLSPTVLYWFLRPRSIALTVAAIHTAPPTASDVQVLWSKASPGKKR